MPRDPFVDFLFGRGDRRDDDINNGHGRMNNHDPFNDPFFRQFSDMSRHMDQIFEQFFNDSFPNPHQTRNHDQIIFESPPSMNRNIDQSHQRPDLSKINPNIKMNRDNDDNNNSSNSNDNNNRMISRHRNEPRINMDDGFGIPRIFRHFFEPEYDQPTLSDVNPDVYNHNHGPIMNDEQSDSNLIHPNGPPPGFRSPYLPNWNGQEKSMSNENDLPKQSQSFFRSQSVVISTTPDGRTTKKTTIRDENGNIHESTETFDNNNNNDDSSSIIIQDGFPSFKGFGPFGGFPKKMIDFGFGHNDDNDHDTRKPSLHDDILNNGNNNDSSNNNNPWIMRPNDPFGRWRNTIDGWTNRWKNRWKGYWFGGNDTDNGDGYHHSKQEQPRWFNWNGNQSNSDRNNGNGEWFWKYRKDDKNNGNNEPNGGSSNRIEWKSKYDDYRRKPRNGNASNLRDQIVKPRKDDDNDNK